jgi:hypothetical protein
MLKYLIYLFYNLIINVYIYIRKTRQFIANYLVNKKQIKKIFDMVKVTKSSPIFKQSRAKNVCTTVYQSVTNFDLTAMPPGGDAAKQQRGFSHQPAVHFGVDGALNITEMNNFFHSPTSDPGNR